MRITSCGTTDVGVKRTNNEDNYLINDELNLFVVCDGMGGHAGGEFASAIAVNTVEEVLSSMELSTSSTVFTAMALANSPPAWPPIPSQTTKRFSSSLMR